MRRMVCGSVLAMTVVALLAACNISPQQTSTLEAQANYWQQVGTNLNVSDHDALGPSLVLDSYGNPTVSWYEYDGVSNNIYVKRWNGSGWVRLGNFLDVKVNRSAGSPSIALDSSGNPTVSWNEDEGDFSSSNVYVKRWNGSSWVQIGTTFLDVNTNQEAGQPSLALDSSGKPTVSWREYDGTSYNIYVKRWNGGSWVQLGTTFLDVNANRSASNPSLALDSLGNPTVSWDEYDGVSFNVYVKRWNGSSWVQLGTTLDVNASRSASSSSLALDSLGNPTVSWSESDGVSDNVYVKRWDGSNWVRLGNFLDVISSLDAYNPSLALDSSGKPTVSWNEYNYTNTQDIYVKRWNGSRWVQVGTTFLDVGLYDEAYGSSLAVDSSGNPTVSWYEFEGGSTANIYVKRYLSNAWQNVGGPLDRAIEQKAVNSSLTLKSTDLPVVAWEEMDASRGLKNVYVKEWTGTTWNSVGGAADTFVFIDTTRPSVTLRDDLPIVAFQAGSSIQVQRWTGSAWAGVGTSVESPSEEIVQSPAIAMAPLLNNPVVAYVSNGGDIMVRYADGILIPSLWNTAGGGPVDTNVANAAFAPSLAVKSDDSVVVAWHEDVDPSLNVLNYNVYVKQLDGSTWTALGGPLDRNVSKNARDAVVALRASDEYPVVAWEEAGNIYVKRWDGATWVSLGGVLDVVPGNEALLPVLDLRLDDNPVVTWQEFNGSDYDLFAKRWTGNRWVQISTTPVDLALPRNAERPAIVLKSNDSPVISFDEEDSTSKNIYVRQF